MSSTGSRYEGIDELSSEEVTRKVGVHLPDESLCERVDELIRSHQCEPLLFTTGSRALIEELAARSEGLEEALRELALEVQEIAASQKRISDPAEAGGGDGAQGSVGERFSLAR